MGLHRVKYEEEKQKRTTSMRKKEAQMEAKMEAEEAASLWNKQEKWIFAKPEFEERQANVKQQKNGRGDEQAAVNVGNNAMAKGVEKTSGADKENGERKEEDKNKAK